MPFLLARLAGVGGILLLLASLATQWFGVPGARLAGSALTVITVAPRATLLFKAACLLTLTVIAAMRWRGISAERQASVLTLLLVALFFYPCVVMTWTPAISAQASWLNTQHENLSWLGGDIFAEQEYKDINWKSQLVVADAERQVGVFRLPNWSPYMMQWGRVGELAEWLGYSNRFCQFVCKGWFAALAGVVLLLLSYCRGRELHYQVARTIGFAGISAATAGIALALAPPMVSGFAMMQARHASHRGDRPAALRWLGRAATILPAIRQDTYFVVQRGLLENALGRDTSESRFYVAQQLDRQGFVAQARQRYERLISETAEETPMRREALRAILRMGINDLNSGSAAHALDTVQYVLEREPCNLKALYVVQLAGLRTARFELVRVSAARMMEMYARFNTLTKAPVLAACNENLAAAAFQEGRLAEALALHNTAIGRPQP